MGGNGGAHKDMLISYHMASTEDQARKTKIAIYRCVN